MKCRYQKLILGRNQAKKKEKKIKEKMIYDCFCLDEVKPQ